MAKANAYTVTMYLMAGLLVVGFACNLLVRRPRHTPTPINTDAPSDVATVAVPIEAQIPGKADWHTLAFRWSWVGIPLALGVSQTIRTSLALFR